MLRSRLLSAGSSYRCECYTGLYIPNDSKEDDIFEVRWWRLGSPKPLDKTWAALFLHFHWDVSRLAWKFLQFAAFVIMVAAVVVMLLLFFYFWFFTPDVMFTLSFWPALRCLLLPGSSCYDAIFILHTIPNLPCLTPCNYLSSILTYVPPHLVSLNYSSILLYTPLRFTRVHLYLQLSAFQPAWSCFFLCAGRCCGCLCVLSTWFPLQFQV